MKWSNVTLKYEGYTEESNEKNIALHMRNCLLNPNLLFLCLAKCNSITCENLFFPFILQCVLLMLNLLLMVNICAVHKLFFSETKQKVVLPKIIIFYFRTHFLDFPRLLLV